MMDDITSNPTHEVAGSFFMGDYFSFDFNCYILARSGSAFDLKCAKYCICFLCYYFQRIKVFERDSARTNYAEACGENG